MRILHVYRTYFPDTQGGLEEVIRQICTGTQALGAQPTVLTTTKTSKTVDTLTYQGTTVVRLPESFEVASCNVALSARQEFIKQVARADLIHYHFPWPFADLLALTTPSTKPIVITYHSDIVRQRFLLKLYSPLMNRFLESAHKIVCTSPNYFATSSALTRFEDKVDVIPIGINPETYTQPGEDVVRETELRYGKDFFLFVGVLRYYKGLHILLKAIVDAPFSVVIVGAGPTEQQLKTQAEALGLTNAVFTGHVPNETKAALFELSRAIVFPSYLRSEAFGVTLLEGAMHEKPLISTEVGSGTSHVNVHGETGLVIAPGSPRALRKAMNKLYDRPDMARLMGKRAKERFERYFTGDLMAKRYWDLYNNILERVTEHPTSTDIRQHRQTTKQT